MYYLNKKKNVKKLTVFTKKDLSRIIQFIEVIDKDIKKHELKTLLSISNIVGHEDKEGNIISTGARIIYDDYLTTIGFINVHPNYRRLGLAKEITTYLSNSENEKTVHMLIPTKMGQPLYEQLDFEPVEFIHKILCDEHVPIENLSTKKIHIVPYNYKYLEKILKLDEKSFGAKREDLLLQRIKNSEKCLVAKDENDKVVGFGLSIHSNLHLKLGPIVSQSDEISFLILQHLSKNTKQQLRVDTPIRNYRFIDLLLKSGFYIEKTVPIMTLNKKPLPLRDGQLYGIASQLFG